MKHLFKTSISLLLIALAIGCSSDDGVSYSISGTPELVSVSPGYERMIVKWNPNATSSEATSSKIYSSDGTYLGGQYLSSTNETLEYEVTNLAEGTYTIYIQNEGSSSSKISAPSSTTTVEIYGAAYSATLANRTISDIALDSNGGTITWGTATSEMIGTRVYYTSNSGYESTAFCSIGDDESTITDALAETEFSYATLYLPVSNCIDSIPATRVSGEISFPESADGIIKVSSPYAMAQMMSRDSVYVLLETGDYRIEAADVTNGLYPYYGDVVADNTTHSFFYVTGSNSTFDFGGSTVTITIPAYQISGYESFPLHFIGNDNVVKNMIQVDEGDSEVWITGGVTNVTMDGRNNTLESCTIHAKGSYPYGYGEMFGKGGTMIIAAQKHCGVLIRGNDNSIKACSLYNKVFGHGIFMQAAVDVTITDCYVEGEMKTTNEVLAEKGTGSPADLVDFLTYWGYTVPEDFTFCLMEDGIRIYNSGNTMIDGVRYTDRPSENTRVTGCYVKNARAGIVLDSVLGTSEIEDCTAIGCDLCFSIEDGHILRCFADCQYGPAFQIDNNFNDLTIDITLLPNDPDSEINGFFADNGAKEVANIYGYNNDITLKAHESLTDANVTKTYWINFGGKNNRIGSQQDWDERYEHTGRNNTLRNETSFPIHLYGKKSDGVTNMSYSNEIETAGYVWYEGDAESLNTVTAIPFGGDE